VARKREEPVRLTRIYTRGGDQGQTSLGDGRRVPKTDLRIEACGTVDELNAAIGLVLALGPAGALSAWLARVQNELFDLGADLSVPEGGTGERLRVSPDQVAWLESRCDEANAPLEPLSSFVLPGGSERSARLHNARTVCRRAERRVVALAEREPVNASALAYLNRLSDLLFILARAANASAGVDEPLWVPGASRDTPG
jgi:cob(I)alamin adenosyltransferase